MFKGIIFYLTRCYIFIAAATNAKMSGKWSNRALTSKAGNGDNVQPLKLEDDFFEESHIRMGDLMNGNAFVHVYKMTFVDIEFDYVPYIVCGDQKLTYYLKYGGMTDKLPLYPKPTDEAGKKQLFPKMKPIINYENVHVPKRELKNQVLHEMYMEKGSPPDCLEFGSSECLNNPKSKWCKGTFICIDLTQTEPAIVTAQLEALKEISCLPGFYNPTAPKSERFIPHGVDRKYDAKVEVIYHDINEEAADWLEAFFDKIKSQLK